MSDKFQLFRLSLLKPKQHDLFSSGQDPSRSEYLSRAFGIQHRFVHYKNEFHFKPAPVDTAEGALMGRLGRSVTFDENLSPEEGLVEVTHEGWKACVIVVDPSEHADGQKVSVQVDGRVGTPISILQALVDEINHRSQSSPYHIEVEPIFDSKDFWSFVEENRGNVTSITFEFIAPNGPWNTTSDIKDEMRAWREKVGAQKVITTFQSEDGLDTNSKEIGEAVDYIRKGSGKISAKARGNKRFSSKDKPKSATIEEDAEASESMIVRAARHIAKVLGRE